MSKDFKLIRDSIDSLKSHGLPDEIFDELNEWYESAKAIEEAPDITAYRPEDGIDAIENPS